MGQSLKSKGKFHREAYLLSEKDTPRMVVVSL